MHSVLPHTFSQPLVLPVSEPTSPYSPSRRTLRTKSVSINTNQKIQQTQEQKSRRGATTTDDTKHKTRNSATDENIGVYRTSAARATIISRAYSSILGSPLVLYSPTLLIKQKVGLVVSRFNKKKYTVLLYYSCRPLRLSCRIWWG